MCVCVYLKLYSIYIVYNITTISNNHTHNRIIIQQDNDKPQARYIQLYGPSCIIPLLSGEEQRWD